MSIESFPIIQQNTYHAVVDKKAVRFPIDRSVNAGLVALRRTITPYVGEALILFGVTAFLFYVAVKSHQSNILWAAALMWFLFTIHVALFGMRYRIFWDKNGILMRASGGPERRISWDEISDIRCEISPSQSRPCRRIEVYGRPGKDSVFVDISLRHFRLDDIEKVLKAIRTHRPDLPVLQVSPDGKIEMR